MAFDAKAGMSYESSRQWRPLDLFRTATRQTLIRAGIAVAVAWVPLLVLCASHGSLRSFLRDYASGSRFLIVLPVLILAQSPLHKRLVMVAHHFENFFVSEDQRPRFEAAWSSHEKMWDSMTSRLLLIISTYATAAFLSQYLNAGGAEFNSWWTGGAGFRGFSLAGAWAFFVSYPLLGYYVYLWLWRQFLWARFLRTTALCGLRLIAAHPDHLGGLGFLEASILGQLPFSFCIGVGLAGAIANRIFNEGYKLSSFRIIAPAFIVLVLLICVVPYLFFSRTLMAMRRRGMSRYGAFARAVGEQFERKWLDKSKNLDADVLTVSDFSATADLFGVVHNIDEIRIIPVGAVDIYAIVLAAVLPGIPVVIATLPFDVLLRAVMRMLF